MGEIIDFDEYRNEKAHQADMADCRIMPEFLLGAKERWNQLTPKRQKLAAAVGIVAAGAGFVFMGANLMPSVEQTPEDFRKSLPAGSIYVPSKTIEGKGVSQGTAAEAALAGDDIRQRIEGLVGEAAAVDLINRTVDEIDDKVVIGYEEVTSPAFAIVPKHEGGQQYTQVWFEPNGKR